MDETTDTTFRTVEDLPLGQIERRAHGELAEGGELVRASDDDGRPLYKALAYDTGAVDLHGTTIAGDAFRSLPVGLPILCFHERAAFPVGKVTGWESSPRGPVAHFVLHDITSQAREAAALIEAGFLSGVSIGFVGYQAETRAGVPTYTDVELIELSLTPTPSSRGARIEAPAVARDADELVEAADAPQEPAQIVVEAEATDEDQAPAERDLDALACEPEAATVERETPQTLRRITRLRRLG
jgi:uncharacterized protein